MFFDAHNESRAKGYLWSKFRKIISFCFIFFIVVFGPDIFGLFWMIFFYLKDRILTAAHPIYKAGNEEFFVKIETFSTCFKVKEIFSSLKLSKTSVILSSRIVESVVNKKVAMKNIDMLSSRVLWNFKIIKKYRLKGDKFCSDKKVSHNGYN
jgi:hypothetical protein